MDDAVQMFRNGHGVYYREYASPDAAVAVYEALRDTLHPGHSVEHLVRDRHGRFQVEAEANFKDDGSHIFCTPLI